MSQISLWYHILQWPKQLNDPLEVIDPEIADIIELEKARQWKVVQLCCVHFVGGTYFILIG